MNWCSKLNFWPFNRQKRLEEAKRIKEIEAEFRAQLEEAYSRRGDLDEVTAQLRKTRQESEEPQPAT